jgi:hypothetical protein
MRTVIEMKLDIDELMTMAASLYKKKEKRLYSRTIKKIDMIKKAINYVEGDPDADYVISTYKKVQAKYKNIANQNPWRLTKNPEDQKKKKKWDDEHGLPAINMQLSFLRYIVGKN